MKLNKVKIARLTDDQAKSINGGGTNGSTQKNFTCCWCTSDDTTFNCNTVNPNDAICGNTYTGDQPTNPTNRTKVNGIG